MTNILFICKASIEEGLGHLVRALTLADYMSEKVANCTIEFNLISDLNLDHIVSGRKYQTYQFKSENEIMLDQEYSLIFLDMLELSPSVFSRVSSSAGKVICLSPIFNRLSDCDILISRTKYVKNESLLNNVTMYCGLEYSIIRPDCHRIPTHIFEQNIKRDSFHIAISMGGTDPNNLTLDIVSHLKELNKQAVFWVMLGEGYSHQYEKLTELVNKNRNHEVILAKTNKSLWHIMYNCNLAILTGGVTSYEAAYAGLPAINFLNDSSKSFLIRELEEHKLSLPTQYNYLGIMDEVNKALDVTDLLLQIHYGSKIQFQSNPIDNIIVALGLNSQ